WHSGDASLKLFGVARATTHRRAYRMLDPRWGCRKERKIWCRGPGLYITAALSRFPFKFRSRHEEKRRELGYYSVDLTKLACLNSTCDWSVLHGRHAN